MDNDSAFSSTTKDLKSKLQKAEEIESSLNSLNKLLDVANRCGLNKDNDLAEFIDGYKNAYRCFCKGNLINARMQQFKAISKFFQYIRQIDSRHFWIAEYIYCLDFFYRNLRSLRKGLYKLKQYLEDKMEISNPADDIKSRLQKAEEIDFSIRRLKSLLDVANRCDLDTQDLNQVKDGYKRAYSFFINGELTDAHLEQFDAYLKLFQVVNDSKLNQPILGFRIWSLKYTSFMMRVYGIWQLLLSILSALACSYLLISFVDRPYIFYGVPHWAVLFAGLGYSIQTIMGVVGDVRANGSLSEEKHLLYPFLLIVALIFGYLAYILIDLGMLTFGASQGGESAPVGSSGSIIGVQAKIVACFLAGYATDDFIKNLKNMSSKK